jgi:hypothetical protein
VKLVQEIEKTVAADAAEFTDAGKAAGVAFHSHWPWLVACLGFAIAGFALGRL